MSNPQMTWLQRLVHARRDTLTVAQFRLLVVMTVLSVALGDLALKWVAWWYLPETTPVTMVFVLPNVFGIGLRVAPSTSFFGLFHAAWVGPARMAVALLGGATVLWVMIGTRARAASSLQLMVERPRGTLSVLCLAGATLGLAFGYFAFQGHVVYAHWPLASFSLADVLLVVGFAGSLLPERPAVQAAASASLSTTS